MNCTNVLFDGFTAKNSPFWTIHPVLSTNVTATNLTSLGSVGNTDGFDPESCTDVLVKNATIQVGDDAIAIKAGRDRDGWTYYKPTQNVVIQNCTLTAKVGGVAMGSEMSAGIRNVYVEDIYFLEFIRKSPVCALCQSGRYPRWVHRGHLRQTADRRNGEQFPLYDWSLR